MKKEFILLCLMASQFSCASYTVNGISIYDRQIDTSMSPRTAKAIVNFSLTKLGHKEIFEDWDFVFTSAWLLLYSSDGKAKIVAGLTSYEEKAIFLRVNKCYWDSGIIHEMMHVILLSETGNGDSGHKNKKAWKKVEEIEKYMIELNCPKGYRFSEKIPRQFH